MATCPHCQEEYSPPSAKFCDQCGKPIGETPAASAPAQPDLVMPDGRPVAQVLFCVVGNEELFGDRIMYRCPKCARAPVCDTHFNLGAYGMCPDCWFSLTDEDRLFEMAPRSSVRFLNGNLING